MYYGSRLHLVPFLMLMFCFGLYAWEYTENPTLAVRYSALVALFSLLVYVAIYYSAYLYGQSRRNSYDPPLTIKPYSSLITLFVFGLIHYIFFTIAKSGWFSFGPVAPILDIASLKSAVWLVAYLQSLLVASIVPLTVGGYPTSRLMFANTLVGIIGLTNVLALAYLSPVLCLVVWALSVIFVVMAVEWYNKRGSVYYFFNRS